MSKNLSELIERMDGVVGLWKLSDRERVVLEWLTDEMGLWGSMRDELAKEPGDESSCSFGVYENMVVEQREFLMGVMEYLRLRHSVYNFLDRFKAEVVGGVV